MILDRPRHAEIIRECREIGCRIRLISDGDVAAAIEVAKAGSSTDMMFGIGGTPEGELASERHLPSTLKRMGPLMRAPRWDIANLVEAVYSDRCPISQSSSFYRIFLVLDLSVD